MDIGKTVKELKLYFELYPIENNPHKTEMRHREVVRKYGLDESLFLFASNPDATADQTRILSQILDRCSDDELDSLMESFGEDSPIGQIIRCRRIAECKNQLAYNTGEIESELGRILSEHPDRDNPFYAAVCRFIDLKGFSDDAEFYKSIGMKRQLFARIRRSQLNVRKETALWIIVGLGVNYREANMLLRLAGYSFKNNDLRDVILSYIMRRTTEYTLMEVNRVLYDMKQKPIGV